MRLQDTPDAMHRASAAARQLPGGAGRHRGSRCESQKPAIARTRWKDHQQGTHTSAAFRPRWMDNKEGAQRRQQRQRPRRPGVSSVSVSNSHRCWTVSRDCQQRLSARIVSETVSRIDSRYRQQRLSAEFVSGVCQRRLPPKIVSGDRQQRLSADIASKDCQRRCGALGTEATLGE